MSVLKFIASCIAVSLFSCYDSTTESQKIPVSIVPASKVDTSNTKIYEFLKMLIVKQRLDTTYGLVIFPFSNLDLAESDSLFLQNLLLEKGQKPPKKPYISLMF